jgi:hypothetical protein
MEFALLGGIRGCGMARTHIEYGSLLGVSRVTSRSCRGEFHTNDPAILNLASGREPVRAFVSINGGFFHRCSVIVTDASWGAGVGWRTVDFSVVGDSFCRPDPLLIYVWAIWLLWVTFLVPAINLAILSMASGL